MSDEYKSGKTGLTDGGPLEVEDLDLSGLGLYRDHQIDPNIPAEDYFLTNYTAMGQRLWARKSEEGKKWHIYEDSGIILQKDLVSKKAPIKRKKK